LYAWTDRLVLVGTRPKGKRMRGATSLQITPITVAHSSMDALRTEASAEGFRLPDGLIRDWEAGANRFDQPDECLFGAWSEAELGGVGGLNRDPYVEGSRIGRIRHLYVRRSARQSGVGSALLQRLLNAASSTFYLVRVRTDTCEAAAFYLRHGFLRVADEFASHVKSLR
jgi:GNAT superfamily N-acetyltransferase